ncbi:MAG TPA: winged helix-turn-helix domain-containing protein [Terriglobales bacterium]|jgi:hypothetical protein|nr:winged helix-turn-helix domain-containing protein [Terriglobales bacterium]
MPMPPSNREARLLRFGVFEVDLDAGELRKNGARIRLQEQPFQVLAALLQNAGQVVTRDHLREKIWRALFIVGALFVTAAVGIPLRFYLLSAVAFDFRKLAATFGRLFPFVLALDQLWAVAPFLLLP